MDASNWGKYANNLCTLTLKCENPEPDVSDNTSAKLVFRNVSVPNIDNFPHKKRCMLMVKDLSIIAPILDHTGQIDWSNEQLYDGPFVSVEMDGLAVQNNYNNIHNQSNSIAYGTLKTHQVIDDETEYGNFYLESSCVNPLTDGVLCGSPFGKQFTIRIIDMYGGDGVTIVQQVVADGLQMFLTLKLLFLDEEDMKQV